MQTMKAEQAHQKAQQDKPWNSINGLVRDINQLYVDRIQEKKCTAYTNLIMKTQITLDEFKAISDRVCTEFDRFPTPREIISLCEQMVRQRPKQDKEFVYCHYCNGTGTFDIKYGKYYTLMTCKCINAVTGKGIAPYDPASLPDRKYLGGLVFKPVPELILKSVGGN